MERSIENEFTALAARSGMGLMVWSPLASGLLSGKYKPSQGKPTGEGRLQAMAGSNNPAFAKFTDRNWKIVEELERVAKEVGRSMAQVALNWVANRPGVGSVIIGASKPQQLADNLGALDFAMPEELSRRLDRASIPEPQFPYIFFTGELQKMIHGQKAVGDKPDGYHAYFRV